MAASPPAASSGTERRSAGRPAPRSVTRAGRAIRDGPEPGHLTRRRARSKRRPMRPLERRANGTGAPARPAEIREGWRAGWPKASSAGRLGGRRASGKEGGEHGHELKIRRPGGMRAHAPWRGVALSPCRESRRVGGATAPGASWQNRRSRGLFAEGHDPKEGGGLCPNHAWSRTKRISLARERDR